MPQFMVLIQDAQADDPQLAPAKTRDFIAAHAAYEQRLRADAAFVDGERLRPSSEGRRVRRRDGEARVELGPFAEAPLTGYYVLEAPSLEGAVALDERAWIGIMDAIDESSREGFPTERMLGGVRLEAPGTGRRVAGGGHRALFDGPFLESKEVIGGVFFLRMDSLDDAVRWASGAEFVKYGAVEIRELWRS